MAEPSRPPSAPARAAEASQQPSRPPSAPSRAAEASQQPPWAKRLHNPKRLTKAEEAEQLRRLQEHEDNQKKNREAAKRRIAERTHKYAVSAPKPIGKEAQALLAQRFSGYEAARRQKLDEAIHKLEVDDRALATTTVRAPLSKAEQTEVGERLVGFAAKKRETIEATRQEPTPCDGHRHRRHRAPDGDH